VQVTLGNRFSSGLGEGVLRGLSSSWDDSVGIRGVELHEFGQVKLGLLKDLDLLDENILKWEDLRALLSDSLTNLITDELLEKLSEG